MLLQQTNGLKTLSVQKKIAFSLFTTASMLAVVELAFYLFGIAPVTKFDDPFVAASWSIASADRASTAAARFGVAKSGSCVGLAVTRANCCCFRHRVSARNYYLLQTSAGKGEVRASRNQASRQATASWPKLRETMV